METITIHTADKDTLSKIKAYLNKLEVSYDIKSSLPLGEEYQLEFAQMILERTENAGKGHTIEYTDELKKELFKNENSLS